MPFVGTCTWYKFAREILQDTSTVVHPVTSAEYPQVALRPHHAVMSLAKARSTGFVRPDWHEALAKFMADY
ncbi:sugar nucleotide-binding protein [Loigolactobacillus bifermentans]|uniref:sugar nucleotide-binding protein n=1 Tax=Loigolactobacillus bifermentans TaxID=1607 RepID=UPI0009F88F5F|nr:sugar nucleotide-binding protein [Loigolactobacillus bifermentans]